MLEGSLSDHQGFGFWPFPRQCEMDKQMVSNEHALLYRSISTDLDLTEEEISIDQIYYLSIFVCYYQETLSLTLD